MIYKWCCQSCGRDVDVERMMAESHVGPEEFCECGVHDWARKYEAPMIMHRALPDGTQRKGFAELKEAARLEVLKADMRPEKRGEIQKEINKLESIKK